ncbi:MAG TPA: hypothetical protein VN702_21055 [Acetobacteraceae bacterium]|nr:hypothetical protein [Acetobacteraceae bacterium]
MEEQMCPLCAARFSHADIHRARVLQLLALVEHPDALPTEAALRIGQEILALTRPNEVGRRCDAVDLQGQPIEEPA